jgi:CDP-2,3-bis-(O-geranylgeranyl)-sn-glycerol synthase
VLPETLFAAFWFFLPAYAANPLAVVFGGGTPMDLGRRMSDGKRLLGDGKTWAGFAGGLAGAVLLGLGQTLLADRLAPWLSFGALPASLLPLLVLPLGALLGDVAGSFVKRRMGKARGERVAALDQYDFFVGALALALLVVPDWIVPRYFSDPAWIGLVFVIFITPVLHRLVNVAGFRLGAKDVPW